MKISKTACNGYSHHAWWHAMGPLVLCAIYYWLEYPQHLSLFKRTKIWHATRWKSISGTWKALVAFEIMLSSYWPRHQQAHTQNKHPVSMTILHTHYVHTWLQLNPSPSLQMSNRYHLSKPVWTHRSDKIYWFWLDLVIPRTTSETHMSRWHGRLPWLTWSQSNEKMRNGWKPEKPGQAVWVEGWRRDRGQTCRLWP